jgi:hypothetical protein
MSVSEATCIFRGVFSIAATGADAGTAYMTAPGAGAAVIAASGADVAGTAKRAVSEAFPMTVLPPWPVLTLGVFSSGLESPADASGLCLSSLPASAL